MGSEDRASRPPKEQVSREERKRLEKERKDALLEMLKREVEGLSDRWRVTQYLSGGSYGEVCGAVDTVTRMPPLAPHLTAPHTIATTTITITITT